MDKFCVGTVNGYTVDFTDPQPDTICLDDIATGLANVSRFAGQLNRHYSVAAHSICVARTVWNRDNNAEMAVQAILHDASEAYSGDCPSPLKAYLRPWWGLVENRLQNVIYNKYGVTQHMFPEVKVADQRWCVTEKEHLQPHGPSWGGTPMGKVEPYKFDSPLHPLPADKIAELWLRDFERYHAELRLVKLAEEGKVLHG